MMNTNPELVRERANCPFNKEEITNLLDGGPEATEERRKITRYFLNSEVKRDRARSAISY